MIRRFTQVKKRATREKNYKRNMPIYERGAQLLPADYLLCHQEADHATTMKVLAEAHERRERRAAKRVKRLREERKAA